MPFGSRRRTSNEVNNQDVNSNSLVEGVGFRDGDNNSFIQNELDNGAIDSAFNFAEGSIIESFGFSSDAVNKTFDFSEGAIIESFDFSSDSVNKAFDIQQQALQTVDDATSEALRFVSDAIQPERKLNEQLIFLAAAAVVTALVVPAFTR